VLEESPSPALDEELRTRMSEAAVAFARKIGYRSAGTAEFMLDGRDFWFLELNGRIQVEHTGHRARHGRGPRPGANPDRQGEPMAVTEPRLQGAAVEVRLYAEDPVTFLPQTGRIERLRLPLGIRVDAGVEEGDEIGTRYDPLIAKLIAHGPTREDALDRLADALDETEVEGLVTNLSFLRWLVAHPALREGRTTTAFLTENPPLSATPLRLPEGPWAGGFRLNLPAPEPVASAECGSGLPGPWRRRRAEHADRADARHRPARAGEGRRDREAAAAARRARGDEDGRRRSSRHTSRRPRRPRERRRPRRGRHRAGGGSRSSSRRASGASSPAPCRP
jgi:hypothetical protein